MAKIAVVVTARPSFARVQTVLEALQTYPVEVCLIFAGSSLLHHYGEVVKDCPYPIAHRVYSTLDGHTLETSAQETGLLTLHLSRVFGEERPDIVVTIADRHETMATALAASYQHIPLAHIQGGEQTGSIDDKVRNAVSMLADLHFPATDAAAERLYHMAVPGDIVTVGCPSVDLALRAVPDESYAQHIVVLQHPVTNEVAYAESHIEATYQAVTGLGRPVLWLWPGQDAGTEHMAKRLREHRDRDVPAGIEFRRHLPARRFLSVLRSAAVLVGNSSVGPREGTALGTPVVDIGTRQVGREHGDNVIHCGYDAACIRSAIQTQLAHGRFPPSDLYGDGTAGERIARVLASSVGDYSCEIGIARRPFQEHSLVCGWTVAPGTSGPDCEASA